MRAAQMPAIARWLLGVQHTLAAAAFERVLAGLRRDPRAHAKQAFWRILLPNAHALGLLLETAMTLAFGSLGRGVGLSHEGRGA